MVKLCDKDINTLLPFYDLNNCYKLQEETYIQWVLLISAIPRSWKYISKQNANNTGNLLTYNHHAIRGYRILTVDKLTSSKPYPYLILTTHVKCFFNM